MAAASVALALSVLVVPLGAEAQQAGKVYRIGLLAGGSATSVAPIRADVLERLRDLGYREGENITLAELYADEKLDRLPALAKQLIRLQPDVILTQTTPATVAARRATAAIPIVVVTSGDLVGAGVIASLARPGGNVTGLSFMGTDLAPKQMELLKQMVPGAARMGLLAHPGISVEAIFLQEMERAAPALGLSVRLISASGASDYETAFAAMTRDHVSGVVVSPNIVYFGDRKAIVELAARSRIPAIYGSREFAEAGGLCSYGINRREFFGRAALYVDKIFKGARPADLPIEQPTKFELVINVRTARALGLSIPSALLLRANQVIE